NGLGIFAHDGGNGVVRATAYEKFTTDGNGAGANTRLLQVGDQFTMSLHCNNVSFSANTGIYFNDSINFAEGQFANTNRLSLTLHTDGKWYLNQNGVDTYVNVPVGTDPTLLLTITSSNTFNFTVKTGATTVFTS